MFDVGQIIDINRGQGHSGVSGQLGVYWVSVCNKQTNNSENVFSDNVLTTVRQLLPASPRAKTRHFWQFPPRRDTCMFELH